MGHRRKKRNGKNKQWETKRIQKKKKKKKKKKRIQTADLHPNSFSENLLRTKWWGLNQFYLIKMSTLFPETAQAIYA